MHLYLSLNVLFTKTEYLMLEEALESHLVCKQGHLNLIAQDLSVFKGVVSSSQFSVMCKAAAHTWSFVSKGQCSAVYGTQWNLNLIGGHQEHKLFSIETSVRKIKSWSSVKNIPLKTE